jgi:hypothetical protein
VLVINNVATTDDYSSALTLDSLHLSRQDVAAGGGGRLAFTVANASVVARFRPLYDRASAAAEYGPETLVTPSTGTIDNISGVKYRSAAVGVPAQIIATLSEPGDVIPSNANPFTGQIAAGGGFTPPGTVTAITGHVSAAGAILAGTGFTVVKGAAGIYTVNFTTAFSAAPLVLLAVLNVNAQRGAQLTAVAVGSFGVITFNAAGAENDEWFFLAQPYA